MLLPSFPLKDTEGEATAVSLLILLKKKGVNVARIVPTNGPCSCRRRREGTCPSGQGLWFCGVSASNLKKSSSFAELFTVNTPSVHNVFREHLMVNKTNVKDNGAVIG